VLTRSLLRRSLVGLAVFTSMLLLGVVIAAGGDHGPSHTAPSSVGTANALSSGLSRPRAAGTVGSKPNPRAHRPRSAPRRSSSQL